MRLKDIAEIRSGYQFRGRIEPDPNGQLPVIQIKDFDDARQLRLDGLDRISLDGDPERYRVKPGDVLFLSRGHRLFASAMIDPPENAIATGYFFIMRIKTDTARPDYLAWYMNSRSAQQAIGKLKRGTHMPLVSRSDIEHLHIVLPPLDVQERIVVLENLARRERKLMAELDAKRTELIEGACLAAACGHLRPEGVR